MALSEISIIQDALGDDVPLDIINEIAKFLRYNRNDLRTIPSDGLTRIFALNMKVIFQHENAVWVIIPWMSNVYVTRTSCTKCMYTGRLYTGREFSFTFMVNGTPWDLTCGYMYEHHDRYIKFDNTKTCKIAINLLQHPNDEI